MSCVAYTGFSILYPSFNFLYSSVPAFIPGYGDAPSENSSHRTTPNDQMSEYVVNKRSLIDSSANHLKGRARYCLK